QTALVEILARSGEQSTPKSEALELRPQVNLINLTVIKQTARSVAPVVGITGNSFAKLQDRDAAALADRRIPPVRSAAVDQLVEFVARDDALIGGAPCLVMCVGDILCIGRLRATNLYEGRSHCAIEATNFAPFKPYR